MSEVSPGYGATAGGPSPTLSVVTPVLNEAGNLPALRARLLASLDTLGVSWEWLIVDDHSGDGSFDLVRDWGVADRRIRGVRLARNVGSHAALACGLRCARGRAVVLLAADLQDPPELVAQMLARWRAGSMVVWGLPQRRSASLRTLYYALLRGGEGLDGQPLEGGDMVLLDRVVVALLVAREERNSSLFARIRLAGFSQASVAYTRAARSAGSSGWTLRRKFKLVLDSLTGFNHTLVRAMTRAGLAVAVSGLALALYVVWNALRGSPPAGWSSLMVVLLLLGGGQMIFLGLLGEYAWRTLEEVRGRPLYVVEVSTDDAHPAPAPEGGAGGA